MRYLVNKSFIQKLKKELRKEKRGKEGYLKDLFYNMRNYKSSSLGSKLYKVMVARGGQGKSGSYRNIIYLQTKTWMIAVHMFSKGDEASLTGEEFQYLKVLSKQYDRLTENIINQAIQNKIFEEVFYDKRM